MTDLTRCGDAGGTTLTGRPCRRLVSGPGELCPAHQESPIGRVLEVDGTEYVDEFGMAVRLGLADTPPAIAAEVYPGMQLVDAEERPDPGEVLEGVPVFAWVAPQEAARQLQVSARHLLNLEQKGLPVQGEQSSKRYPLPHLIAWWVEYQAELARRGSCRRLPFRVAWARYRIRVNDDEWPDPAA